MRNRLCTRRRPSGCSDYGETVGLPVLLESMNNGPADAEVRYLGCTLEEYQHFFDKRGRRSPRWSFTSDHAHLVPEGIDGFLDVLDIGRCGGPRRRPPRHEPGDGTIAFGAMFRRQLGYRGHFTTPFGSLPDMIEGREYLAREGNKAGIA